jgi:nucleoid-associated protein YgaU
MAQNVTEHKPPVAAIAAFLVGLVIVPSWEKLHSPTVIQIPPPIYTVVEQPRELDMTYTAQPGDSFQSVAREKYGMEELWKRVRDDNKGRLRNPGQLSAGDVILLPKITISPK